ncbi:MAG TPA: alpha-L-arabinofuranosidase C-terminal domain-containing protein [Sediminibacterium sp.]|nr:alpha-L-arabinofuranosidase C-terminal domain-containing protein [Sediminibacterium sp.]
MKKLILLACLLPFSSLFAQTEIILDADQGKDIINRNIYGHFSEHLGHCIYGGFYVGDHNTEIPNRGGVRLDVVEALKKMKIPLLRWPGGCFADTYHWKDGVGPKDKRPSMLNVWWGNVKEDNSFGTNEFLNMCELLGAEPYISGNVGSGTPQELSDWIKYTDHPNGTSPMTDYRQQNGRSEPWHVKYWGIGNEAWGCGGNMTPEYYANLYRQFATFMNGGREKLFRIASGASDADYHWTEVLMRDIPHNLLDGIGVHHYSVINWQKKSSATDFTEQEYFTTMQRALDMKELVEKHSAIMDKYDPAKKVAMVVDEWGGWYNTEPGTNPSFLYQQNTMRDAMIAGATLNIFNNHCDRVRMANLAQAINVLQAVILTDGPKMLLTPTYHVMEMYSVHQDATLLPIQIKSAAYTLDGKQLDAISASASKDKNGLTHISLVNIDAHASEPILVHISGASYHTVTGRILSAAHLQDHNTFDHPDTVKPEAFTGASLQNKILTLTLPPFSVVVLELKP